MLFLFYYSLHRLKLELQTYQNSYITIWLRFVEKFNQLISVNLLYFPQIICRFSRQIRPGCCFSFDKIGNRLSVERFVLYNSSEAFTSCRLNFLTLSSVLPKINVLPVVMAPVPIIASGATMSAA